MRIKCFILFIFVLIVIGISCVSAANNTSAIDNTFVDESQQYVDTTNPVSEVGVSGDVNCSGDVVSEFRQLAHNITVKMIYETYLSLNNSMNKLLDKCLKKAIFAHKLKLCSDYFSGSPKMKNIDYKYKLGKIKYKDKLNLFFAVANLFKKYSYDGTVDCSFFGPGPYLYRYPYPAVRFLCNLFDIKSEHDYNIKKQQILSLWNIVTSSPDGSYSDLEISEYEWIDNFDWLDI